ncbi:glycerophosphodiester phosphodiesterase [Nocardioides sp. JQ2195]|uniref:glycerophosphodiester phosphodiesterase n=1 Tax=Nocardioides sp. JQ2195 TaxID=2592334 RepID=UPI00143E1374|nr:glycerophosphodiester phosphodiesterase [Nocardioides sp. JQ2195]QIX26680.1 glycerophosphodiester phosphodiesterase [Nocardioides sp. JQ2195]
MDVLNAVVTRRRSGFPYLDEPVGVLAFAHRGGAFHPEIEGLENTMAAFRHAVDLGYRYLETDVHVTRDGVLLAFHDTVLDRVTDLKGEIASLTYAEVQGALIGGKERVPTLAELFDAFPDARFNIDIKAPGAVRPLADFIEARNAHDRILVGSFSRRHLGQFRRLTQGRVPTSAHPGEVVIFLLSPTGGIARLLTRGRVQALQVPHRKSGIPVTNGWLVRKAHAAGAQVHVWTIDEPEEMAGLIDRGVDGLMTDRTDILKDVLVERGQWEG